MLHDLGKVFALYTCSWCNTKMMCIAFELVVIFDSIWSNVIKDRTKNVKKSARKKAIYQLLSISIYQRVEGAVLCIQKNRCYIYFFMFFVFHSMYCVQYLYILTGKSKKMWQQKACFIFFVSCHTQILVRSQRQNKRGL